MRASLYSLLCGLAAVRAADVALMVVEATGTTSSSYTSPVQSAFAGFGWVVTTRTASSTATGFVEVPAQGSYDVAQLEKLQTCAFRTTLEAAYEMAPWSLTTCRDARVHRGEAYVRDRTGFVRCRRRRRRW